MKQVQCSVAPPLSMEWKGKERRDSSRFMEHLLCVPSLVKYNSHMKWKIGGVLLQFYDDKLRLRKFKKQLVHGQTASR